MDKLKYIKLENQDGSYSESIPLAVNSDYVDIDNESLTNVIINQDTKLNKKPFCYNSVLDMKTDVSLAIGDMVITFGYHSINDGGGAKYRIINGNHENNGGTYHKLDNNLYAELIFEEKVNAQWFGAYGDGVHDDTSALQNAIDYCRNNHYTLTSNSDKTYLITSSLNFVTRCDIDFNYAKIITNSAITMLYFDTPMTGAYNGGFLRNIKIDMNNIANYGIYCNCIIKKIFSNMEIVNCSKTAFHLKKGYEVFVENSHFYGTSIESIGLELERGDSHYTDIIMIDMHTSIKIVSGGPHFLTRIHSWIWHNDYLKNSKFLHVCENGGEVYLNQCYSDTYQYAYYSESEWSRLWLNSCKNYNNESFFTTDWIAQNGDHYLFYAKDANPAYLSHIWVNSGRYSGLNRESSSYTHAHIHNINNINDNYINMTGQVTLASWSDDCTRVRNNQTKIELEDNDHWELVSSKQNVCWSINNITQINFWLKHTNIAYTAGESIKVGQIDSRFLPVNRETLIRCPIFTNGNYGKFKAYATAWIQSSGTIWITLPENITTTDYIYVGGTFLNQRFI